MKTLLVWGSVLALSAGVGYGQTPAAMPVATQQALVTRYCAGCHSDRSPSGGFSWTKIDLSDPGSERASVGKGHPQIARRHDAAGQARRSRIPPAQRLRFRDGIVDRPGCRVPALCRRAGTAPAQSHAVSKLGPRSARPRRGCFLVAAARRHGPRLRQYSPTRSPSRRRWCRVTSGPPARSAAKLWATLRWRRRCRCTRFRKSSTRCVTWTARPGELAAEFPSSHNFPADGDYTFKLKFYYDYLETLFGQSLPPNLQGQEIEVSIDGARVGIFKIDPTIPETKNVLTTRADPDHRGTASGFGGIHREIRRTDRGYVPAGRAVHGRYQRRRSRIDRPAPPADHDGRRPVHRQRSVRHTEPPKDLYLHAGFGEG